jgi:hypothetical protein
MRQTQHPASLQPTIPHLHLWSCLRLEVSIPILAKVSNPPSRRLFRHGINRNNHAPLMYELGVGLDGVSPELSDIDRPEVFLKERFHPGYGDGHDVSGGAGCEIAAAGEELVSEAHGEFSQYEAVVGPVLHGGHHEGSFGVFDHTGGPAPHAAAAELVVWMSVGLGWEEFVKLMAVRGLTAVSMDSPSSAMV